MMLATTSPWTRDGNFPQGRSGTSLISGLTGRPGSLTMEMNEMRERYLHLQDETIGDVELSRLLDSAKLLYAALQPLRVTLLREVANQVLGSGPITDEVWEILQRRTYDEGFGRRWMEPPDCSRPAVSIWRSA